MKCTIVTAPATMPVSVAEVKAHSVITFSDDDTLIESLIHVATDTAEQITGRQLISQVWDHWFDCFPSRIEIPMSPLISIGSVKYFDGANVEQTLSSALYYSDLYGTPAVLTPVNSWPATYNKPNAVVVRVTAGYANAGAIPAAIKHGILTLVSHLYENRETTITGTIISEVPMSTDMLLRLWAIR